LSFDIHEFIKSSKALAWHEVRVTL